MYDEGKTPAKQESLLLDEPLFTAAELLQMDPETRASVEAQMNTTNADEQPMLANGMPKLPEQMYGHSTEFRSTLKTMSNGMPMDLDQMYGADASAALPSTDLSPAIASAASTTSTMSTSTDASAEPPQLSDEGPHSPETSSR